MTPIESLMESVDFKLTNNTPSSDLPYATHSGVLKFAGLDLRCYRLSNGQTVFDASDIENAFGFLFAGE